MQAFLASSLDQLEVLGRTPHFDKCGYLWPNDLSGHYVLLEMGMILNMKNILSDFLHISYFNASKTYSRLTLFNILIDFLNNIEEHLRALYRIPGQQMPKRSLIPSWGQVVKCAETAKCTRVQELLTIPKTKINRCDSNLLLAPKQK